MAKTLTIDSPTFCTPNPLNYSSISLNDDFDELIMLRKLKKVLKDTKSCVYFQRMGTDRVTFESLARDHPELFISKELCAR